MTNDVDVEHSEINFNEQIIGVPEEESLSESLPIVGMEVVSRRST